MAFSLCPLEALLRSQHSCSSTLTLSCICTFTLVLSSRLDSVLLRFWLRNLLEMVATSSSRCGLREVSYSLCGLREVSYSSRWIWIFGYCGGCKPLVHLVDFGWLLGNGCLLYVSSSAPHHPINSDYWDLIFRWRFITLQFELCSSSVSRQLTDIHWLVGSSTELSSIVLFFLLHARFPLRGLAVALQLKLILI